MKRSRLDLPAPGMPTMRFLSPSVSQWSAGMAPLTPDELRRSSRRARTERSVLRGLRRADGVTIGLFSVLLSAGRSAGCSSLLVWPYAPLLALAQTPVAV